MLKGKNKKSMQCELLEGDWHSQASLASSSMEDKDMQTELDEEQTDNANLGLILKELREFRKDNGHTHFESYERPNQDGY